MALINQSHISSIGRLAKMFGRISWNPVAPHELHPTDMATPSPIDKTELSQPLRSQTRSSGVSASTTDQYKRLVLQLARLILNPENLTYLVMPPS
jgi:hypothetical protein